MAELERKVVQLKVDSGQLTTEIDRNCPMSPTLVKFKQEFVDSAPQLISKSLYDEC